MFDEYLEHTNSPDALGGLGRASAVPAPYEGWEQGAYADVASPLPAPSASPPIFDLSLVQFTPPAPLLHLAASSNVLFILLTTSTLLRIDLAHADTITPIEIPSTTASLPPDTRVFPDPTARHVLVCTPQGENYYIFESSKKARALGRLPRGTVVESVAWNRPPSPSSSTSTGPILLGTRQGTILEVVLSPSSSSGPGADVFRRVGGGAEERYVRQVFALPEPQSVSGLRLQILDGARSAAAVIATTSTRVYTFVGALGRTDGEGGGAFESLFTPYAGEVPPKFLELPGELSYSEVHFWTPPRMTTSAPPSPPKAMAWLTGPGIYHSTLVFPPAAPAPSPDTALLHSAALLPYPASPSPVSPSTLLTTPPLHIALTQHHFLLLYSDRLRAIRALDDRVVWEETLGTDADEGELVRGMAVDEVAGTVWLWGERGIWELAVRDEERDVWSVMLERRMFEDALKFAKTPAQRDLIHSSQADDYFAQGRFLQASQSYASAASSASFEHVALRFVDAGEMDALRWYVSARLERTRKGDLTQRMMLATWLLEIYLSKCNDLEDAIASASGAGGDGGGGGVDDLRTELAIVEDDLRGFLEGYKANLDKGTVYDLIASHGRTDVLLHFAELVGDYAKVAEHWVMEEEWERAIGVVNRQSSLDLYYRFASVLLRNAPDATVASWMRQPLLDPRRLIPAVLNLQHRPSPTSSTSSDSASASAAAIRYLHWSINSQATPSSDSPTVHNALVSLLASASDEPALLRYLSLETPPPRADLDYALRLCADRGMVNACVQIYGRMGRWEESVDLALERGDLELAKMFADKPEGDEALRKKLWLKIARVLVQDKKDIKSAMRFLEASDLLKVEDILPFFPSFAVVDDFKDEICAALERYAERIRDLKSEMDDATRSADHVRRDIDALRQRFVVVEPGEKCRLSGRPLAGSQFYVFPSGYAYTVEALIEKVTSYAPPHVLRRIIHLQNEIARETNSPLPDRRAFASSVLLPPTTTNNHGTSTAGRLAQAGDRLRELILPDALAGIITAPRSSEKRGIAVPSNAKRVERLKAELDEILAASDPLCDAVVAELDRPFVQDGEGGDEDGWAI